MTIPFSATTLIDRDDPLPGERRAFDPDCCDPDDTSCDGCGALATDAITFHRDTELFPTRRVAYCAEHAGSIAEAVAQMLQQQAATQN